MKILPAALLPILLIAGCGQSGASETPATAQGDPAPVAAAGKAEALLGALVDPRQPGPYAPRDECTKVSGADDFRLALARAVVARDADALVKLAAPDVLLDFGGGSGPGELRRRLDDPDYRLWDALANLLPLGCAVNPQGGFTIPWYFAQDFGERDSFMTMIVRGAGVPLLAEPKDGAKPLRTLSWNAVELDESTDEGAPFAKVKDDAGTAGYIAWDRLRSLIDYRLIAEERDEGWQISALVAGD